MNGKVEVYEWQGDQNFKALLDGLMYTMMSYLSYFVKIGCLNKMDPLSLYGNIWKL